MSLSATFRRLADVIDELEADGVEVTDAVPRPTETAEGLVVDLQIRLDGDDSSRTVIKETSNVDTPAGGASTNEGGEPDGVSPETREDDRSTRRTETGESGEESAAGPVDAPSVDDPAEGGAADGAVEERPLDGTGRIACRHGGCGETFDTEHGMKIHHTKVHVSGGDVEDAPPHRDPAALREVYEAHDSFTEMRDALGADVSAQTVRRQMMKHGIHDPDREASDGGSDGEEEPAAGSDGTPETDDDAAGDETTGGGAAPEASGDEPPVDETAPRSRIDVPLPGDLTVEQLRGAVETADTVYEVQQHLGLGRDETTALLETFDLLELVHGRVATKPDRDDLKAEIDDRIRANADDRSLTSD